MERFYPNGVQAERLIRLDEKIDHQICIEYLLRQQHVIQKSTRRTRSNTRRDQPRSQGILPFWKEIASNEGTTQGDPIAMAMYALGILPLLQHNIDVPMGEKTKRIAYADDFTGIGTLQKLKQWWDDINKIGPYIGYYPKASKSVLIVKEEHAEEAAALFVNTQIRITTKGHRHLGAVVGDSSYKNEYVSDKVKEWVEQIIHLSKIARTHPHRIFSIYSWSSTSIYIYHENNPKHIRQSTTTRKCN